MTDDKRAASQHTLIYALTAASTAMKLASVHAQVPEVEEVITALHKHTDKVLAMLLAMHGVKSP